METQPLLRNSPQQKPKRSVDNTMELSLDELRDQIDTIDEKLLQCLNQRAELAVELGKIKLKKGQAIVDASREAAILKRLKELNKGPLSDQAVQEIFEQIVVHSRHLQEQLEQS